MGRRARAEEKDEIDSRQETKTKKSEVAVAGARAKADHSSRYSLSQFFSADARREGGVFL